MLRVYVVGRRATLSGIVVFLLSMAPFATNLYNIITTIPTASVFITADNDLCIYLIPTTAMILESISRGSLILADAIVIAITWRETYATKMAAASAGLETPLTLILLRDGTLYFLALLALNAAQLGSYLATQGNLGLSFVSAGLSSIIVSRFLLNLRIAGSLEEETMTRPSFLATESCNFAPFVAMMGAELDGSFGQGSIGLDAMFDDMLEDENIGGSTEERGGDTSFRDEIIEVAREV